MHSQSSKMALLKLKNAPFLLCRMIPFTSSSRASFTISLSSSLNTGTVHPIFPIPSPILSRYMSSTSSEKDKNQVTENVMESSEAASVHADEAGTQHMGEALDDMAIESNTIEELKKGIRKLREEHSASVEKTKDLQNKLLRCYADQENSRKRFEKEVESTRNYAITNFAKSILPVADNLSLATASIDQQELSKNEQLKHIYEGVQLTESIFHSCLGKFGVEKFDSMGEKFDPTFHEALFEIENSEMSKGSVGRVLQNGYKIKDRVLRAAKVGVVKK